MISTPIWLCLIVSITASTTGCAMMVPLRSLRRQDDWRIAADVDEQMALDVDRVEIMVLHGRDDPAIELVARVLAVPNPDARALGRLDAE